MADWQENFSSLDLREEETVLAIRLAEALRTDEVETFLQIYDSIPSTTETKRVSIKITTLLFLFLKSATRLEKLKLCKLDRSVFFPLHSCICTLEKERHRSQSTENSLELRIVCIR